MPSIVLSILENSFAKFVEVFDKIDGLAEYIEIDVMDGIFVPDKSFEDIERLNELKPKSKFKVHLMVEDALAEIAKWKDIKNVAKIVFHIEARSDPRACVNAIRGQCRQVGIAVKPATPLAAAEPYFKLIDELMFMTVNPGQQGGKFLPEVGEKIKEFNNSTIQRFNNSTNQLINQFPTRPLISVDGGINKNTIATAASWGVNIFGVGSAVAKAENPKKAYEELKLCLT